MHKWSEKVETGRPNIISSRIRLAWNWSEYALPSGLNAEASAEVVERLRRGPSDLGELDGRTYVYVGPDELSELDLKALKERRVLNSSILAKESPVGLLLPEKEDVSLILSGMNRIRLQVLSASMHLSKCHQTAEQTDNYINTRFPYVLDDKYGHLTSFLVNVGTDLRMSVIVHLPSLSLGKKFGSLLSDMSRFGVSVKSVYGKDQKNYGALYEIPNQTTMGRVEKELIGLAARVAGQLNDQENQVHQMALEGRRLEREDEAYESYGVLKYAGRLSTRETQIFLSQLTAGAADGILELSEPCLIYRLTLGIQTADLRKLSDRPLDKEELGMVRAAYLRKESSEIKD